MKPIIREYKDTTVVSFEIIDWFAEEQDPEVFTEELDRVELGGRAWTGGAEAVGFVSKERMKY
jgi:hypothetical protein